MGIPPSFEIGDVVMLHDSDTGFSQKPVVRPYAVVAIAGSSVTVVPRTASGSSGIKSPAGDPKGLSKHGRFVRVPIPVSRWLVDEAQNLGPLSEGLKSDVIAMLERKSK